MRLRERCRLASIVVLAVSAMGASPTPPLTTTTTAPDPPIVTATTLDRPPVATTTTTTTLPFDPSWQASPAFALRVAVVGEPPAWNPWVRLAAGEGFVGGTDVALFRRLPPLGTVAPLLAAVPEPPAVRRIGSEWLADVPLRPGITWSDGVPVTAADVEFSYRQAMALGLGEAAGYGPGDLVDVRRLDDHTVRFVWSSEPSPASWAMGAAFATVHPAHYWSPRLTGAGGVEALDPGTGADAPSAGPFRPAGGSGPVRHLVAVTGHWEGGSVFVAHADGTVTYRNPTLDIEERYGPGGETAVTTSWVQGPFASSVEVIAHSTQDQAVLAAAAGRVDLVVVEGGVDPNLLALVSSNPRVRILTSVGAATATIDVSEPLVASHPELLASLDCVLDREAIARSLGDRVVPATSPILLGWSGWGPTAEPRCSGSPEARLMTAVERLAAAGWEWSEPPRWDSETSRIVPGRRASVRGSMPALVVRMPKVTTDPMLATVGDRAVAIVEALGVSVRSSGTRQPADLSFTVAPLPSDPWSWNPGISTWDPTARLFAVLLSEAGSTAAAGHHAQGLAVLAGRSRSLIPIYRPIVLEPASYRLEVPVLPVGGIGSYGGLLETIRPATP
jgi:ABC-type transport system substrate-binding protein